MRTAWMFATIVWAGCAVEQQGESPEPTAPNQLREDGKADGGMTLWAGLSSYAFERYAPDPCDDGRNVLGDAPVIYDEYVRERATLRNLCFEVWSPGITDWDNPDFWKQLDVEAHYGFVGSPVKQAYVSSIDRRGNNRRYAWGLDFALDPTAYVPSIAEMPVPFEITSEGQGYASITADLAVTFTVNGRTLNAPSNKPFVVRYEGTVREGELAPSDTGYVLHDIVTCDGARFGSGAGFFVADISSAAAIGALAPAGGDLAYGVGVAVEAGGSLLSATYTTQRTYAGEVLPGFEDPAGIRVIPSGSTMRVELDTYDRAAKARRTLTASFAGCHL